MNEQHCVSRGPNPDNPERILVLTKTGEQIGVRPNNLEEAEILPGKRVSVVAIQSAPELNGRSGEVCGWQGERWIVDLEPLPHGDQKKERKSLRGDNLVILPENLRKRPIEAEEPEAKRLKDSELKDICVEDEVRIQRGLAAIMPEHPILYQKAVCVLATKMQMTIMHELAQHMTDKQNDGLLRRVLKKGELVKGIEELDALEQCQLIAERRMRSLAGMVRINYCDLREYIKKGFKEPKFRDKLETKISKAGLRQ